MPSEEPAFVAAGEPLLRGWHLLSAGKIYGPCCCQSCRFTSLVAMPASRVPRWRSGLGSFACAWAPRKMPEVCASRPWLRASIRYRLGRGSQLHARAFDFDRLLLDPSMASGAATRATWRMEVSCCVRVANACSAPSRPCQCPICPRGAFAGRG